MKKMVGTVATMAMLFGIADTAKAATPIATCPYAITSPGSYVLTKNLTVAGTCITISANTVTLDMQSHTITGNGTGNGITDGGGFFQAIVIANGTVQDFETGVVMNSSYPVTLTGMTVQKNLNQGIALFGAFTVINTRANGNGVAGIRANGNLAGAIFASEANGNEGNGIVTLGGPTLVMSTTANANTQTGIALSIQGGVLTPSNQVIETEANDNGGDGIDLSAEAENAVIGSTALRNTGTGIVIACPGNAASNIARNNGSGNLSEVPGSVACANFNNTAP
jgi:hypothetical protein